jgi:hypothetical protein
MSKGVEVASLDGPGFHVELDALEAAATGIKRSVDDQNNFELLGLCGEPDQYGHADVHAALAAFCARWSEGLDTLAEDAGVIGDSLTHVAEAYRSVDADAVRTLTADPGSDAVDH